MSSIALYAIRIYQQSFDARPYTTLALTNGSLSAVGDAVAQAATILSSSSPIEDERQLYSPTRTLRFFTFGSAVGPIIGRWIKFLEYRFPLPFMHAATSVPHGPSTFSPLSAGMRIGPRPSRSAISSLGVGVPIGRVSHGNANSSFRSFAAEVSRSNDHAAVLALAKRVAADQLLMAPIGLAMFIGAMSIMEGHDMVHIRRKFADIFPSALVVNWQVWPIAQIINFGFMPLAYRVPFQSTCGIFWNLYLSLLNAQENKREEEEDIQCFSH